MYVVQKWRHMLSSLKNKATVAQIKEWNNLTDTLTIHQGTTLQTAYDSK
jgi:LysM repeat protein